METSKSTFEISYFIQRTKINKKTGLAPIIGRITIDGESTHFSTKMHIDPERWELDEKGKPTGRTIGKTVAEKKINETLEDFRSALRDKYNQMILLGSPATPTTLKNGLFNSAADKKPVKEAKLESIMLVEFTQRFNEKYFKQVEQGKRTRRSWSRYTHLLGKVKEFMNYYYKIENIPLHEMTTEFFEDFFNWLRETYSDQDHNYHMKMVQRLGTVHRKAKTYGYVKGDPYSDFETTWEKKDRGYLDENEIRVLINKPMPSKKLDNIRDFFVFSCYTGLAHCDVRKLRKDEIKVHPDGTTWIHTERGKTGNKCDIPVLDIPLQIIEKHKTGPDQELLMKVPSNQNINDYLKVIQAICGIEKRLSFHLARHTFATTVTLLNGVPIETVSKMLGHGSIRTTQIYARVVDEKIDRDMRALRASLGHQEILSNGVMQNPA